MAGLFKSVLDAGKSAMDKYLNSSDPNLVKAHYRKGRALYEQINVPGAAQKAIASLEKAHQLDQTIPELNDLLDFAREELKEDEYVPVPAEQERF